MPYESESVDVIGFGGNREARFDGGEGTEVVYEEISARGKGIGRGGAFDVGAVLF